MKPTMVRMDEESLKAAKRYRINVSQAAREGVDEAIRRRKIEARLRWLERHRFKPERPSLQIIREIRESE